LAANTAKEYPRSSLEKKQYLAREDPDHITNHVCPQFFKSKREDVTGQERGHNANVHLQSWDDKQFGPQLKVMGIHGRKLHRQGRKLYRRRGTLPSNQS
jgi:hypothetical protein